MLEMRRDHEFATSTAHARGASGARRSRQSARWEGMVRDEILPRLLQVHSLAHVPGSGAAAPYQILADALIGADEDAAVRAFAHLSRAAGDDVWLMQEVLAPAARRLGDWWREDACDFLSVSQGTARLRLLLASLAAPTADTALAPAMLMLTPPGETHRFGAEMAADLFRREGWRVERADGEIEDLRFGSFDAVAVSCGCEAAAASLPSFIANIRARTRKTRVPILLGGALFLGQPARGQNLGVDYIGSDPNFFRCFSRHLLRPRHV